MLNQADATVYRCILGIDFFDGSAQAAIAKMRAGGLLVVPAAPALKDLDRNADYRESLLNADLAITDSAFMVLIWNSLQGDNIRRLSGLEYLRELILEPDVRQPGNTLWIMASPASAKRNLDWLKKLGITIPEDNIYMAPIYGAVIEDTALLERLNRIRPQHVVVTIGGGTQERLGLYLKRNLSYLPAIHCIGAAIAFLSGDQVFIPAPPPHAPLSRQPTSPQNPEQISFSSVAAIRHPADGLKRQRRAPIPAPGQTGAPKERFWLLGVECPGYTDPNLPRRQKESTRLKKALITGVTGQDGAYLAEFLLAKGYEVHGIKRRASLFNTARIDHIYEDPHNPSPHFILHYGDLTDSSSLIHIVQKVQPDEIYNLGAQSHVQVSFEQPEYTADADALGPLRLLEAIRILGLEKKTRFYQASTSELYGLVQEIPQKETTPFYPRSPYAVAKMYAYWICVNYREAYGIYACNGILFNHESPLRGETFVTRKITRGLARIKVGLQDALFLGNLDSRRDWGHARDYIEMQWLMLQQEKPQDFVIATGQQYSVREFVKRCAKLLELDLIWQGSGVDEKAIDRNGKVIVSVDPRYFRPTEVDTLLGDPTKAQRELGWTPRTSFDQLVEEMIASDLKAAQRDALVRHHGFDAYNVRET